LTETPQNKLSCLLKDVKNRQAELSKPYGNLPFSRQPEWYKDDMKKLTDEELIVLRVMDKV